MKGRKPKRYGNVKHRGLCRRVMEQIAEKRPAPHPISLAFKELEADKREPADHGNNAPVTFCDRCHQPCEHCRCE